MPIFFHSKWRSFYFLNITQFLGALNDNIFKLLVVYLLINLKGAAAANAVLSIAGAVFVIPFLLFSSSSGVLADRHSKRSIIVFTKILEIFIMVFGLISVAYQWEVGAYSALFLMGTQSAIFGPSKYGIIPELIETQYISKANGLITSFTYLSIILGTFLASFLTDISNMNFVFVASFCVFIAIIGLLASLGIHKTVAQNSPKKMSPLFLHEIYQTIKFSWNLPYILPVIFGSAYFLFIGAFTQLNIIPFAMQSLHLSEIGGGYLFLATAVGIAVGAILFAKLSRGHVEPGISCICGLFIAFFFFALFLFSSSLGATIANLALLGIFGGGFLIPFDSYLQVNSPNERRGQIIAASNFFSFVGVLLASFALYLFSETLGFSAASAFGIMSLLTLFASFIIMGRLSGLFFPFLSERILTKLRPLKLLTSPPSNGSAIALQTNSWLNVLLLLSLFPKYKIIAIDSSWRHFPWFNGVFESVQIVSPTTTPAHQKLEQVVIFYRKEEDAKFFGDQNIVFCHMKKTPTKEVEVTFKTRK